MPTDLAAPYGALAFTFALMLAAGTGGYLRQRHDPGRSAGVLVGLIVLGLTMAAGVVIWAPCEPGDEIEVEARARSD